MSDNDELDEMTGPQKAAVIMFAMGEERAARLFGAMDDDEIKELSQTMANLGMIDAKMVESLFIIFAKLMSGTGSLVGSFESTERLLIKSLGAERVEGIMEEIRGPAGRTMWDKLGNVNEATLATYLKNEYPQTVAVVLSKIKGDHAARVLSVLPENFAMEVIMRLLRMETVQKDILDGVEKTLRSEFMSNLARTQRQDSHEQMADIFNNLDRSTENRFMGALEERNRESAERIKSGASAREQRERPQGQGDRQSEVCRSRRLRIRFQRGDGAHHVSSHRGECPASPAGAVAAEAGHAGRLTRF